MEELKIQLIEKLNISRHNLNRFCRTKTILESLKNNTTFLPEDAKLNRRAWHIINGVFYIPLCKHCNLEHPSFNNNKFGYLDFCSIKCQRNSDQVKKNLKDSLEKKYGNGVINPWQSSEVKDKIKNTMIEKYGVEHNSHLDHNRIRASKYFKSNEFKEKTKITINSKYGVDHYSKSQEFKEKFKETCLLRYGAEHPMQDLEVFNKQIKNSKRYKKYTLPSGKYVNVQGYEDIALNKLFKEGYSEDDIVISNKGIENIIGKIFYFYKGNKKRYFPDFYIKSTNTIIEVKSSWTFDNNGKITIENNINFLKKKACEDLGFNFKFFIE